jgi:DNA-binding transcriptional MocR family regulator
VADEIVLHIEDRSAPGIAAAVSRLITSGELAPGAGCPRSRELARRLGISPTTVSEAWRACRTPAPSTPAAGGAPSCVDAPRPAGPGATGGSPRARHFALDLSTGTPDPDLLPGARPGPGPGRPPDPDDQLPRRPVVPALDEALRGQWPFPPEALTVVDGAMDALDRIDVGRGAARGPGAVENPCFHAAARPARAGGRRADRPRSRRPGDRPEALPRGLGSGPSPLPAAPRPEPVRRQHHAGAGPASGRPAAGHRRRRDRGRPRRRHRRLRAGEHRNVAAGPHRCTSGASRRATGPDLRLAAVGGPAR